MIEVILFYLALLDAICANLLTWFDQRWYTKHFRLMSRFFPPSRGWSAYYLLLVLWIGWLLARQGLLG